MSRTDLHDTCPSVYIISYYTTEIHILPCTYICITLLMIITDLHDICLSSVCVTSNTLQKYMCLSSVHVTSYYITQMHIFAIYIRMHHFTDD